MGQSSLKYIIPIAILIALAFFTGRCSSGRAYDQREVDRLNGDIRALKKSEELHAKRAQENYAQAQKEKTKRIYFEYVYKETLAQNAKLSKAEKDAKAKLVLKVGIADSSRFTEPVVNGILTLDAENVKLESDDVADSLAIAMLDQAYVELDSAYRGCTEVAEKKDQVITTLKKKNKKPHWWELPLVGLALVGGFVLGSL